LNSQAYTQAAWWNHIPVAAWALLAAIAISCNVLLGYNRKVGSTRSFIVLPLIMATAFYLIAELDSPRGGLIRIKPLNLISVSEHLHSASVR